MKLRNLSVVTVLVAVLVAVLAATLVAQQRIIGVVYSDGTTRSIDTKKLPSGWEKAVEAAIVRPPATPAPVGEKVEIRIRRAGTMAPAVVSVAAELPKGTDTRRWDCRWSFGDKNAWPVVMPIAGAAVNPSEAIDARAAHFVYEKPGTYTITLTATSPAGAKSVATTTFQVKPDTRRRVTIDPAKADTQLADLAKAIEPVAAMFSDDTTYKLAKPIPLTKNEPLLTRSYEPGKRSPVLISTHNGDLIDFGKRPKNAVIIGLDFDSTAGGGVGHIWGDNVAYVRCVAKSGVREFVKCWDANGVLVWHCDGDVLAREFVWAGHQAGTSGDDGGIYFCQSAGSRGENVIRNSDWDADGWTVFANRVETVPQANDVEKGAINWRQGNTTDIRRNLVTRGGIRLGGDWAQKDCNDNVVADNVVDGMHLRQPMTRALVARNVFRGGGRIKLEGAGKVDEFGKPIVGYPRPTDTDVEDNVFIGGSGSMFELKADPKPIRERGNVRKAA